MKPNSGLTFIELVFAIAIMGVMMGAFYTLVINLNKNYNDQVAIAETQQSVRVALSLFSNEVQQAGLDPAGNAFIGPFSKKRKAPHFDSTNNCQEIARSASPIMEASATVFHFMGDKNGNNCFNEACKLDNNEPDRGEDIRYEWVGSSGKDICERKENATDTLYRDTGGGLQEVASGIKAFTLTYYDENGKLPDGILNAGERARIRKIKLTLQGGVGEGAHEKKRELTSEIVLKNRG